MIIRFTIFILLLFVFCYKFRRLNIPSLTLAIIACNRYNYLNRTLKSLYLHIKLYEQDLDYATLFFDQGTVERYEIIEIYKLKNTFLFNPCGMELSFNTLFSYVYSNFVFILEEDWVVKKDVESEILHPSFIKEAILILSKVNSIYGIILRETHHFEIYRNLTVKTTMGNHILYIGLLVRSYAYTNGASIYRTKNLKEIELYNGELKVSIIFLKKGYKIGFTYKGRKGKKDDIYYQHVMDHIGFHTSKSSICSISLY